MNQTTSFRLSPLARLRHVAILAAGVLAALPTPATPQDLGPLDAALRQAGYRIYNPPRSNWGPGFVFAGTVVDGRIINVDPICPHLYQDLDAPDVAQIVLPNFRAEDGFSFGMALNFVKGLFGASLDIDRIERERSAEVQWRNVRELSYSKIHGWLADGQPRKIEVRCRLAIEDLKAKGRFENRVFVITRAVAPEMMTFDFKRALSAEGSASAGLSPDLQAKLQGKGRIKNDTQVEITAPLFVGYAAPVKIKEWVPTGVVSGDYATVVAEPAGPEAMAGVPGLQIE